jgi:uncharacterized protein (DUF1015 family)
MPAITPFVAWCYDPRVAGDPSAVTAPPYDTVGPEARRTLGAHPHNIVNVDLPRAEPGDALGTEYTRAASTLRSWVARGVLRPTTQPATYPYEMRFTFEGRTRRIRGLVAAVDLVPWGEGVDPHEQVMAGPVEERLRLLRAVRTNLSAVYATFRGPRHGWTDALDDAASTAPLLEVHDHDDTRHRLWVRPGPAPDPPEDEPLVIADGHHRYTTALRFREEMRRVSGPGPWDRLMMFLVDAATQSPPVLPIHRVADDAPPIGISVEPVVDRDAALAAVDDEGSTVAVLRATGDGPSWGIAHLQGPPPAVRALHALPGFAAQVDAGSVRFTHDPAQAEAAVRDGDARAAYLLPATSAERIRAVVEARERMPQKSTFFWPKPRTGLVLRPLDASSPV